MWRTSISRPDLDDTAIAARWQRLSGDSPVFRSWTWIGCLAAQRFEDPILIETFHRDIQVGTALFNRRRARLGSTLFLNETGDQAKDAIFIEHNGVVAAPGHEAAVWDATLRAAGRLTSRIVFSGVCDSGLAGVRRQGGLVDPLQTLVSPYVTLHPAGPPFLATLSRNTRAQLRRSDRSFAEAGPIRIERANSVATALDWLERLLDLHDETWSARGVVSQFLADPVQCFHRALIARGVPTGEVDLLRVAAGPRVIGYLLNLRRGRHIATYQSGFDYRQAALHEKPGLTCHHAAIALAAAEGAVEYDFLAGDSRYKRSLATHDRPLHWLAWQANLSAPGLLRWAKRLSRL